MPTVREMAIEAVQVQDACNLAGVVHGLARVVSQLHDSKEYKGTTWVNHHPIVQAWVDKLASLSGVQGFTDTATDAHQWCMDLVDGKTVEYAGVQY